MSWSRLGCALLLGGLLVAFAACKGEEGKRDDFATGLKEKMPKCDPSAYGHENDELNVNCENVDTDYVVATVIPAIKASCAEIQKLGFEMITIVGKTGSGLSWGVNMKDDGTCVEYNQHSK